MLVVSSQQTFIKHLVSGRHCAKVWGILRKTLKDSPCSQGAPSTEGGNMQTTMYRQVKYNINLKKLIEGRHWNEWGLRRGFL